MNEQITLTQEQLNALIADAVKNALANQQEQTQQEQTQTETQVQEVKPKGIWESGKEFVAEITQTTKFAVRPVKKTFQILDRGVSKIDMWTAEAFADSTQDFDLEKFKKSLKLSQAIDNAYKEIYGY